MVFEIKMVVSTVSALCLPRTRGRDESRPYQFHAPNYAMLRTSVKRHRLAFGLAQINPPSFLCHQRFQPGTKFIYFIFVFFQAGEEIFALGVEDVIRIDETVISLPRGGGQFWVGPN
jgi:hypothetical protein